jgi:cytochrome c556
VKSKLNWAVMAMAGVFAVTVVAASEKAPDSYVAAMKTIQTTSNALRQHVTAKDYAAIEGDAKTLKPALETALKFWQDKKVEDATGWAKAVGQANEDLEKAAKDKNDDAIGTAVKAINGSCKTCHDAHRDRQPDGSSLIK